MRNDAFVRSRAHCGDVSNGPVPPMPSCPSALRPTQVTVESALTAHVCQLPSASAVRPEPNAGTITGVRKRSDPSTPHSPLVLRPQHDMTPASSRTHVCQPPAAMATGGLPSPATLSGCEKTPPRVPLPSCPSRSSPQHQTL